MDIKSRNFVLNYLKNDLVKRLSEKINCYDICKFFEDIDIKIMNINDENSLASYDAESKTIFFDPEKAIKENYVDGILIHEAIHHLDNKINPENLFRPSCELSPILGEYLIDQKRAKERIDCFSFDIEKLIDDIKNDNYLDYEISFLNKKIKTELPISLFDVKEEVLKNLEYSVAGYVVKKDIDLENTKIIRRIILNKTKKYHKKTERLYEKIRQNVPLNLLF